MSAEARPTTSLRSPWRLLAIPNRVSNFLKIRVRDMQAVYVEPGVLIS
jgi:hypothetical protein